MSRSTPLWPDILNKIGDAVGAPRVMFGFYDGATGRSAIHAPRFDRETVRSCVEWDRDNPLPGLSAGRRPGSVFTISDFIAVEHFKATAFFREWWRPNGLSLEPLTTNLLTDTGSAAIFTCNQDAVLRSTARRSGCSPPWRNISSARSRCNAACST